MTNGIQAFEGNDLNSLIIGNGLKEIKMMTFSYNRNLKNLQLGNNIEVLGSGCFNSCDALSGYIIFLEKVKIITSGSFTAYDPLKYIKVVICKNFTPPILAKDALPNYDYLQVPRGSKSYMNKLKIGKNS